MGKVIEQRRRYSDERFDLLRRELVETPSICNGNACVYATGSFGRREANEYSDVDLFIVAISEDGEKIDRGRLSRLDEILLKAELVRATRKLGFPEFSKDGSFLQHHTSRKLIQATGRQEDDAENTFTARLLLLLESKPLVGEDIHSKAINDVIAEYWAEFPSHLDQFMPTYLANDVLRYWRTLCLNYEANTSDETPDRRAKRKLKNYKLKHSRMLTCFSALLCLLYVYTKNHTVTAPDAQRVVFMTPTERMEWVASESKSIKLAAVVGQTLELYERFLNIASASEGELVQLFSDQKEAHKLRDEQSRFGDLVYDVLSMVGKNDKFYRRLVV